MKLGFRSVFWLFLACAFIAIPPLSNANPSLEAVSTADPSLPKGVSADGDSFALSLTSDGVFVLLASTANNLVPNDHNAPFTDIFLRNRTNGAIKLVSANAGATSGGNGNSGYASVTPDGRYVVFQSEASDLITNDLNQAGDVFVRDMIAETTVLVSVSRPGTGSGNGASSSPVITPDGRYVAFVSSASDLVDDDTNAIPDVFVRDLQTGLTTLVSAGAMKGFGRNTSSSEAPVITPDGRFVAFISTASNLVASPKTANQEVYVRDLVLGQTLWASSNVTATPQPASYNPVLSDDGRFVAFKTYAASQFQLLRLDIQTGALDLLSTNAAGLSPLVPDAFGPEMSADGQYVAFSSLVTATNTSAVWLWDGETKTADLVSANLPGQPGADGICENLSITPNGRYVAFMSNGTALVTNAVNGEYQVFVHDRQSDLTRLVTADLDGAGSGSAESSVPILTPDGRLVLFDSRSDTFALDDRNDAYDVFEQDAVADTAGLVSGRDTSAPRATGNGVSVVARDSISADGRYVVFESWASDLAPGDTNGCQDVFIRDLVAGTNRLVSVNRFGSGSGNGPSSVPLISADGRYVVFVSAAEDLVANDANKREDVFARDTVAGATLLASVGVNGWSGNRAALSPSISADGRRVVFESTASGLVSGDADVDQSDIFLHDLTAGTTTLVSVNISGDPFSTGYYTMPTISPDGRFVAFRSNSGATVFVKDLQSGSSTPVATNITSLSFSGNSRVFAAICGVRGSSTSRELVVADLLQGTNTSLALISGASSGTQGRLSLNDNGRFVAFTYMNPSGFGYGYLVASDTNNLEDVFLYDVATANLMLVSVSQTGIAPGNNRSNWPRLSADGRYLAFRSAADDLVPGDANGKKDVFLFDRLTGQKTVLSSSFDGIATANGMSLGLEMTPDARLIVFNSVATDLVHGDFNGSMDVFAVGVEQTVPTNQLPVIKLSDLALTSSRTTVSWTVVPGRAYRVQFKDSLDEPEWHDLADRVRVVGSTASYYDASSTGLKQRFYRLLSGD
ncbi:MAG: hypothetical protein AAB676_19660 [Verrucomicrobiota bacterium]